MVKKDLFGYLTSCAETLKANCFENDEMRQIFLVQVADEIKGKETECAEDQRCSRILETLLGSGLDEEALEKWLETFLAPEAFLELSCNQYSSHVVQTLLERAARARMQRGETWPALEKVLAGLHVHLYEQDMWRSLFADASATHVLRSHLLMLAGYLEERKTSKRGSKKGKKNDDALPTVRHGTLLFPELFHELIRHLWKCLSNRDDRLALHAYAAPVAKLAFIILKDRSETKLLRDGLKAVLATKEDLQSLATSGPGSHLLEAALLSASKSDDFLRLLTFFRKSWNEVLDLKPGGVFAVTAVVKSIQDSAQIGLAIDGFPFTEAVHGTPAHQACVVSIVETCLRLRSHFKAVAHQIFVALGVQNTKDYKDAWPRLLSLSVEKAEGVSWNGGALASALLQFPSDAVYPLIASFKVLKDMAPSVAAESVGCRVLERFVGLDSCFDKKLRLKMIRRLLLDKDLVIKLAVGRGSGWLVSAMWKSAGVEPALREELTKILVAEEQQLRDKNLAIWKACECHAYQKKNEEWEQKQKKSSKTQRVFEDIISAKTEERPTTVTALPREDQSKLLENDAVDAEVAAEIDDVFWTTRRRKKGGPQAEEPTVAEEAADTEKRPLDENLAKVLEILGGVLAPMGECGLGAACRAHLERKVVGRRAQFG
eukprot:GEMP01033030.1.p1 GENE.GEMP01033030.1~~GEMP01033030.1.p1  ORF type:complete len:667 (+),score=146.42 GEMP01033030.1:28-2001(+)